MSDLRCSRIQTYSHAPLCILPPPITTQPCLPFQYPFSPQPCSCTPFQPFELPATPPPEELIWKVTCNPCCAESNFPPSRFGKSLKYHFPSQLSWCFHELLCPYPLVSHCHHFSYVCLLHKTACPLKMGTLSSSFWYSQS